jgi:hypothetical protein
LDSASIVKNPDALRIPLLADVYGRSPLDFW